MDTNSFSTIQQALSRKAFYPVQASKAGLKYAWSTICQAIKFMKSKVCIPGRGAKQSPKSIQGAHFQSISLLLRARPDTSSTLSKGVVLVLTYLNFDSQNGALDGTASVGKGSCQVLAAHDGHSNGSCHKQHNQTILRQKFLHQLQLEIHW